MKKFVALLFLYFQAIVAQVQFEARVSKTTLGLNERLRIDFFMNFDGDNFSVPDFAGFKIIAGPSQQVSQSWINGRSSFEKMYSYYLLPTQKGIVTIKSATIEYDGKIYKTNPLKINVTAATEQPKDPNEEVVSADENIYLVADISKTNPYVNEPITVVYKLYFSYNIGITNWREINKPKYNDFWSQNIDIKQLEVQEAIFKGEKFRYVTLRKTVLYPQKSGKLEIEPLSLDIDVQLPTNRRNAFGQVLLREGSKKVAAGAKQINVKPLPEVTKLESFTGAVGNFSFKITPSKTALKAGESLDLVVSVSGKGNLKLFSLPKPKVPNALELYDPVHKEQITTPLGGMLGTLSDTYTIVPQYKGSYTIKPLQFSYFDASSGSYKTLSSQPILLNVLEGATAPVNNSVSNKKTLKITEQFGYIANKVSLQPIKKSDFYGSLWFYLGVLLPFVFIPLVVLFKKKKEASEKDIFGNKIRLNNKLAKKYLSEAKLQLSNKEAFYVSLEKALHNFLKAKLHIETSEMNKDKISELLLSKKVAPTTVEGFIALTENCEIARYAPSSSTAIQNDYEKAVAIIGDLEKQIL